MFSEIMSSWQHLGHTIIIIQVFKGCKQHYCWCKLRQQQWACVYMCVFSFPRFCTEAGVDLQSARYLGSVFFCLRVFFQAGDPELLQFEFTAHRQLTLRHTFWRCFCVLYCAKHKCAQCFNYTTASVCCCCACGAPFSAPFSLTYVHNFASEKALNFCGTPIMLKAQECGPCFTLKYGPFTREAGREAPWPP